VTLYSQIAVIGSGTAFDPTNRSSGSGGVCCDAGRGRSPRCRRHRAELERDGGMGRSRHTLTGLVGRIHASEHSEAGHCKGVSPNARSPDFAGHRSCPRKPRIARLSSRLAVSLTPVASRGVPEIRLGNGSAGHPLEQRGGRI
jgi:hypothetical protein